MMTQNGRDVADKVHRAMITTWPSYGTEDLKFLTLGMVGEAGEVANVVKKMWRGDNTYTQSAEAAEKFINDLSDEIADVQIYLDRIAECMDIDIPTAVANKMRKLAEKPQLTPTTRRRIAEAMKIFDELGV